MGWQVVRNNIKSSNNSLQCSALENEGDEENISGPQDYTFLKILNQKKNHITLNITKPTIVARLIIHSCPSKS